MAKLILFDVDGTLFKNEEPLWRIENQIALDLGYLPVTHERHRMYWYKPTKERLAETFLGIDLDKFYLRLMKSIFEHAKNRRIDAISDNNVAVLDHLKESGIPLGILSSRTAGEMEHLLDGDYGLKRWFDPIYHADNLDNLKPDSRVFKQALDYFQTDPKDAVYVGDLVSDAVCAKEAGLGFIAVLEEGILVREDFNIVRVDYFADNFCDILKFLK